MLTFFNRLLMIALLGILFGPFVMAGITTTKAPGAIQYIGSVPDQGDLNQYLNDVKSNGSPVYGNTSVVSNTVAAGQLMSASTMINTVIRRSAVATVTDTIDSAVNIVGSIPGAKVGDSFWFTIYNFTTGVLTLSAGASPTAGITINGVPTVAVSAVRTFVGIISAVGTTPSVRIESLYAFPSATP